MSDLYQLIDEVIEQNLYQLIDKVIEQIKTDIKRGDVSALESILIQHMPQDVLEGYLEEE